MSRSSWATCAGWPGCPPAQCTADCRHDHAGCPRPAAGRPPPPRPGLLPREGGGRGELLPRQPGHRPHAHVRLLRGLRLHQVLATLTVKLYILNLILSGWMKLTRSSIALPLEPLMLSA